MTVWTFVSILLMANFVIGIILIIINISRERAPSAVLDLILIFSVFICIGIEGNAVPKKPETEYVDCIKFFQNNKIEEPTNEDGSRLCSKYLKEQ